MHSVLKTPLFDRGNQHENAHLHQQCLCVIAAKVCNELAVLEWQIETTLLVIMITAGLQTAASQSGPCWLTGLVDDIQNNPANANQFIRLVEATTSNSQQNLRACVTRHAQHALISDKKAAQELGSK